MSVRGALMLMLKGAAVAGLLLLGASFAPAAEARMRCSYSGPPVLLEGGPFAPGATPENEGTSEIEVEFRGTSLSAPSSVRRVPMSFTGI
jgi:hypothetical protein